MRKSLIIGAASVLALSSCSTITHTTQTASVDTQVYNVTVADMNVSAEKQSVTTEWSWSPLRTISLSSVKENAAAALLDKTGADVLVEPQYVVKRNGLFRGGSVTVTGYPATYSNFRPMTKDDAEVVATINGKIGVTAHRIGTTAPAVLAPLQKALTTKTPRAGHSFINVLGGVVADRDDTYDVGYAIGLMYGHYGHSWGWYGKAVLTHVSDEFMVNSGRYDYREEEDSATLGYVTFGAIKRISAGGMVFLGTGAGAAPKAEGYDHTSGLTTRFAIPVEVGVQWAFGSVNALLGVTYVYNTNQSKNSQIVPFAGVGYSF